MRTTILSLSLATSALAAPFSNKSSWSGWKNVKYAFIFGDSYTQTGFNVNGPQPSPSNPMGNPPYPGWTSANGPNWVDFLTYTYNASYLQTYNMAYGGATVDSALVAPYAPEVVSMKSQVEDLFLPTYGGHPTSAPWKSSDSLFAFWIGINDIGMSWWLNNATLYDAVFAEYGSLLEKIYDRGGRNFLLLDVPPVNQAPMYLENGPDSVAGAGAVILDWNTRVRKLAADFKKNNKGVTTFVFNTHELYSKVIEKPSAYEQTAGLKDTTKYCTAYQNGAATWYTKDESCPYAVNEYLWLNNLHPTFPVHNATAAEIAKLLKSQK